MNIGSSIILKNSIVTRISKNIIEKKITGDILKWNQEILFNNEVAALDLLSNKEGIQQIVNAKFPVITSIYSGEPIFRRSLVGICDIFDQKNNILKTLEDHKVIHRDIMPRNIVIMDKKITLIDFTWSVFPGSYFEKNIDHPPQLGNHYRKKEKFCDDFSFNKTIEELA